MELANSHVVSSLLSVRLDDLCISLAALSAGTGATSYAFIHLSSVLLFTLHDGRDERARLLGSLINLCIYDIGFHFHLRLADPFKRYAVHHRLPLVKHDQHIVWGSLYCFPELRNGEHVQLEPQEGHKLYGWCLVEGDTWYQRKFGIVRFLRFDRWTGYDGCHIRELGESHV